MGGTCDLIVGDVLPLPRTLLMRRRRLPMRKRCRTSPPILQRPLIGPLRVKKFARPLRPRSRRPRSAPLQITNMSRRWMFRLTINRIGIWIGTIRVGSRIAIVTARREKNFPRAIFRRRMALLSQWGRWLSLRGRLQRGAELPRQPPTCACIISLPPMCGA